MPSELWHQKDVHIESEIEILANGVPKAIMLYRSKIVDRMYKAVSERLDDPNISEEELSECIRQLTQLNNVKTAISRKSQRLIL